MTFNVIIDPRVSRAAPDFRAISLVVDARAPATILDPSILAGACDFVGSDGPAWAEAHLAKWDDVYRGFGAKPNRTPNAAAALRRRVLREGRIASVNAVVDLYNAVSLRFAIPVGGENLESYVGPARLTFADGSEPFDTISNGEPIIDSPAAGEIVWRDDVGVTCRRWNWRQGTRTQISPHCTRMWFILEALDMMPEPALIDAADMLADELESIMPGCDIVQTRTA